MSLSKQLYIIISLIFLMIFTGNFIISVINTKEYLKIESDAKAEDIATNLVTKLKPLVKEDINDPEITVLFKGLASGKNFKQIRLDAPGISFTQMQLLESVDLNLEMWAVQNATVDKNIGALEKFKLAQSIEDVFADLESQTSGDDISSLQSIRYNFLPSQNFEDGENINITLEVTNGSEIKQLQSSLKASKIVHLETAEEKFGDVPQWFIDQISFTMKEVVRSVEDDDTSKVLGTLYVTSSAANAYQKLYEQAQGAVIYAIIAFSIAFALLIIFLQFILKPLKAIESLAGEIAGGNFQTIKKLPWTTEIKNVSIAMNGMSSKIEGIIKKLNANLENMTKKLSEDDLTGLQLKSSFLTDMKMMFISKTNGYVFIVKIDNLGAYAKAHTNKEVDQFLIKFANILKNVSDKGTAYRFFGSEFALILQKVSEEEAKTIADNLKAKFEELALEIDMQEIAHAGGTPFNLIGTTDEMISAATEAYEKAKLIGPNEYFLRDEDDLARDMEEWKKLVFDIIDNGKFEVGYIGQAHGLENSSKNQLLMEEAFTTAKDYEGSNIPIGTFISIAEQYEKILDFDKAVVLKVIEYTKQSNIKHSISINLSLDSVFDIGFKNWLKDTVAQNNEIASQLVFSVTAYGVAKDVEKFKYFIQSIHGVGAKIIIKRFETRFIPLDTVQDFNLDYIRLARDYTEGIQKDSTKQGFVESMQELCQLLNIKLFAENVKDEKDFEYVEKLKLYGASR